MSVLITDPCHPDAIQILKDAHVKIYSSNEMFSHKHIRALLIRSKTHVDKTFLQKFENLQYIATATSGLNHIDLIACENLNIECFNPKTPNSIAAAEHTWALILALSKKLFSNHVRSESLWKHAMGRGSSLEGKTLGLIGLGRVGSHVAKIAQAFDMRVNAFDPYKDENYFNTNHVQKVNSMADIFKDSDIISLHTPLTQETNQFVSANLFNLMKPSAFFINTSRGQCVIESDLLSALQSNSFSAAAIDVFDEEPIKADHPFLSLNNLIMTPHVGAFTEDAFLQSSTECAEWIVTNLKK